MTQTTHITETAQNPTLPHAGDPRISKTVFYSLDGIRGIAALLVVMRHTERFFAPWRVQESYLAVDIFFVLSGVVISQAYGARLSAGTMSFGHFARIRLIRIMPLYLLGTSISIVSGLAGLLDFGSPQFFAWFVLLAVFMIPNPGIGMIDVYPLNNPAWSLPLELVVNGVYAIYVRRLSIAKIAIIMSLSAVGIAFTLYSAKSHSLNIGFWAKSFPFGFFRVGYSFFAGVIIFHIYPRLRQAVGHVPGQTPLAWCVLAMTGLALAAAPPARLQPFYDLVCVICVFPAIVCAGTLVQPLGLSARLFRFLGLISYAVYTLHGPLAGFVGGLSHGRIDDYPPMAGVVFLLVLVPISVVADKVYDNPVRQFLLRRFAGKPTM